MSEIIRLQQDPVYLEKECDRFCLVSLETCEIDETIVNNQAKFCVLQVINDYKEKKISRDMANYVINKIDAIVFAQDMLGPERVIEKLNQEVIGEELYTPHFNLICIECNEV